MKKILTIFISGNLIRAELTRKKENYCNVENLLEWDFIFSGINMIEGGEARWQCVERTRETDKKWKNHA